MKVFIYKASDDNFKEEREINSLDDLKSIQDEFRQALVVDFHNIDYDTMEDIITVTVYDDYLE